MRRLSNDLPEFIHLLNTKSVKYVVVGADVLQKIRHKTS